MTELLLYWNHICVLHKQEKLFLEKLKSRLLEEGIRLQVRCFGLGYDQHMSEYLARPDAVLPDAVVSADLEVFEDPRIFAKFGSVLHPVADWLPLRQSAALDAVRRGNGLLPFVSIPLVYYTADPASCRGKDICVVPGLAFGGINNSAGKTLVKAVWSRYGKAAAQRLLAGADVSEMPIGAFQQVRTRRRATALVPSLYALRADGASAFLQIPVEGPLLVSSYLCVGQSAPRPAARRLAEALISKELCSFYAENGDLIVHPALSKHPSRQESPHYFVPAADWYGAVSPEEFYELYCGALPTAHKPFAQ